LVTRGATPTTLAKNLESGKMAQDHGTHYTQIAGFCVNSKSRNARGYAEDYLNLGFDIMTVVMLF
jgi:hypothetical protein